MHYIFVCWIELTETEKELVFGGESSTEEDSGGQEIFVVDQGVSEADKYLSKHFTDRDANRAFDELGHSTASDSTNEASPDEQLKRLDARVNALLGIEDASEQH